MVLSCNEDNYFSVQYIIQHRPTNSTS